MQKKLSKTKSYKKLEQLKKNLPFEKLGQQISELKQKKQIKSRTLKQLQEQCKLFYQQIQTIQKQIYKLTIKLKYNTNRRQINQKEVKQQIHHNQKVFQQEKIQIVMKLDYQVPQIPKIQEQIYEEKSQQIQINQQKYKQIIEILSKQLLSAQELILRLQRQRNDILEAILKDIDHSQSYQQIQT